eukprot:CAMPEP_0175195988 /NCGR_PEP_ID=MMETSP0093-20121207/7280_1 /TAXON_ID=311494 /ORGANISM="Alexandrium monilatum, Strain CCMP3105" /LENGTH=112 /DNA_ID=CAMNT_0016488937 /DNA_START=339 /DNA_END=675 /DNA_ORIENTATION=-
MIGSVRVERISVVGWNWTSSQFMAAACTELYPQCSSDICLALWGMLRGRESGRGRALVAVHDLQSQHCATTAGGCIVGPMLNRKWQKTLLRGGGERRTQAQCQAQDPLLAAG